MHYRAFKRTDILSEKFIWMSKKKRTSLQIPFRIGAHAYMRIPILSPQYGHNINSEHYKQITGIFLKSANLLKCTIDAIRRKLYAVANPKIFSFVLNKNLHKQLKCIFPFDCTRYKQINSKFTSSSIFQQFFLFSTYNQCSNIQRRDK